MKNVLVACEESQTVCKAFRKLGFNAYSCDIQECSGGHPEWHILGDAIEAIYERRGTLQTGEKFELGGAWDLVIGHPPCTNLTVAANKWLFHPDDKHLPTEQRRPHPRYPNRHQQRLDDAEFFLKILNAPVKHVAVENPVGYMNTHFRAPDQIIFPWMFGESVNKRTCLWLKNLPVLIHTNVVAKGATKRMGDGKLYNVWMHLDNVVLKDRAKIRSKTFQGIADAMAAQWGEFILAADNNNLADDKHTCSLRGESSDM